MKEYERIQYIQHENEIVFYFISDYYYFLRIFMTLTTRAGFHVYDLRWVMS